MSGVTPAAFNAFLYYLYAGILWRGDCDEDVLVSLMEMADMYGPMNALKGLCEVCGYI